MVSPCLPLGAHGAKWCTQQSDVLVKIVEKVKAHFTHTGNGPGPIHWRKLRHTLRIQGVVLGLYTMCYFCVLYCVFSMRQLSLCFTKLLVHSEIKQTFQKHFPGFCHVRSAETTLKAGITQAPRTHTPDHSANHHSAETQCTTPDSIAGIWGLDHIAAGCQAVCPLEVEPMGLDHLGQGHMAAGVCHPLVLPGLEG